MYRVCFLHILSNSNPYKMENIDKYKESAIMDLESLQIRIIKEEPPDNKEDLDLETTNFTHSGNEFDNIDTINADIVTYLDVTLENQSDEDQLYDSDLDQAPYDKNCEHKYSFNCEICKKGFRTYKSLQVHSTIHIQNEFANMSTCTICHKKFEARKLTYHFRTHNVKKTYQCYYCSYSYFTQSHLDEHITNSHTTYTCNKCNIGFKKEIELKDHYKSHANEFPYACSICEQTFSTISNLSRHISTHNKKRKYKSYS